MPFYLEKTLFSPKAHARHIYMISPSSFIFSGMAKRVLPQVGDLRGKVGQSAPLLYPSCQSFSFPSTVLFTDTSYSTLSLYSLRPNNSGSGAVNISAKMSLQSQKSQIQKKKKEILDTRIVSPSVSLSSPETSPPSLQVPLLLKGVCSAQGSYGNSSTPWVFYMCPSYPLGMRRVVSVKDLWLCPSLVSFPFTCEKTVLRITRTFAYISPEHEGYA